MLRFAIKDSDCIPLYLWMDYFSSKMCIKKISNSSLAQVCSKKKGNGLSILGDLNNLIYPLFSELIVIERHNHLKRE